ncbi:hypothetical protein EGCR1_15970 (plasmid) [Enterococcus gilvus]|nr:hypothetical protein EGCR1_15970 [Enterococcus gilvus]
MNTPQFVKINWGVFFLMAKHNFYTDTKLLINTFNQLKGQKIGSNSSFLELVFETYVIAFFN